jgi:hypothetical protein
MKKILSALLLTSTIAFAQDKVEEPAPKAWDVQADGTVSFSQLGLHNWAQGGENNISAVTFLNAKANYKKDKVNWDNSMRLGYGVLKQGESDFFKSDDIIEIISKYGYQAKKDWYYSAFLDFKTQFDEGFEEPSTRTNLLSKFMAPGFLKLGLGMDYKPNDNFSVFISPVTMKNVFVLADNIDETKFGLDAGDNVRTELGANLAAVYKVQVMENVYYETSLGLFSNYLDKPENIDVNWSNIIKMTVNKYINVNFSLDMIYDDNTIVRTTDYGKEITGLQLKEVLGVGLTYNLYGNNKK